MRDVFVEDFKRFLIDADKYKLAISFMKALAYCPPSKELCELIQRTILEYSRLSFESDQERDTTTTTAHGGGIASDSRDYHDLDHSFKDLELKLNTAKSAGAIGTIGSVLMRTCSPRG